MKRSGSTRVVLVCNEAPWFQRAGQNVVIGDFLRFFAARGQEVDLIVTSRKLGFVLASPKTLPFRLHSPYMAAGRRLRAKGLRGAAYNLGWMLFPRLPNPIQAAIARVRDAVRRLRRVDCVVGAFLSDAESSEVYKIIRRLDPDFIFYSSIFVVPWGARAGTDGDRERLSPLSELHGRSFIITHDVMHQRCAAFRQRGYRVAPGDLDADREAAVLRLVRHIIAINDTDRDAIQKMLPGSNPVVVTTTVDARSPEPRAAVDPRKCVFVASGSVHNVIGLKWFLSECWPIIRKRVPDGRLHVYGSVCSRVAASEPNVHLEGVVGDLSAAYGDAAVGVVPLLVGSGLKVKLVEAIGYGVATVTTTVGAQGLLDLDPRPFLVADDAAEFAGSVALLLEQDAERERLAERAHAVAPRFSVDAVFEPVADIMFGRP